MKPEHKHISISGTVTAVFAHRFVIEGKDGKHLADIGPDAVDFVDVQEGDKVTVEGERKPSEIKVTKITKGSDKLIEVEHIKRHQRDGAREHRDSVKAVVVGAPRRKAKHFEILRRSPTGEFTGFHVEFDGEIHKKKSADSDDPKWREIGHAL
jgi:hypothetical protein